MGFLSGAVWVCEEAVWYGVVDFFGYHNTYRRHVLACIFLDLNLYLQGSFLSLIYSENCGAGTVSLFGNLTALSLCKVIHHTCCYHALS